MVKVTDFTKKSRGIYITPEVCYEMVEDLVDAAFDFGLNCGKPSEFQHGLNLAMAEAKVHNIIRILAENQSGQTNH